MIRELIFVLLFGICLLSCSEQKTSQSLSSTESVHTSIKIPNKTVDKSELFYDPKKSLWMLNEQLYSGYAVRFYPDSTLKERVAILKGRKQNQTIHWYSDGHYKHVMNYHDGKLSGDKKTWSSDSSHILLSHLKYVSGKPHGEQKKWYPTGELFKKMNLNMGKEEGLQQAFRKNGTLYANYEAREGRVFGLKKATLCYTLDDENLAYKK